jgi:hypothetical protein
MEIWVAPRDLIHVLSFLALLSHGLGSKSFYSGRDKSDLEGITWTFNTDNSIRKCPARCGRKDKVILKIDRESYDDFICRCLYL